MNSARMVGVVALTGGVLVLGVSLNRALRPERPLPLETREAGAAIAPSISPSEAALAVQAAAPSSRQIMQAVSRAPFDPERRAPGRRYQLPGQQQQEAEAVEAPPAELPPVPALRVLGTIAGEEGGIAVIQAEGESPQVVTVGEVIGGYRVASVEEKAVVVSLRDWQISLALEEGTAADPSGDRTIQEMRRGRQGSEELRQQLETFVRNLQERLGSEVQVVVEGGRAYLVGPDGQRREIQLPAALARIGRGITIRPTVIPPATPPPGKREGQGAGDAVEGGAGTEARREAGAGAETESRTAAVRAGRGTGSEAGTGGGGR